MNRKPIKRTGTADVVPATLLYHRAIWMAIRRQSAGSYLVALPQDSPRLRSCLLRVVQSLLAKGLPVCVLEMPNILANRVPVRHENCG